MKKDFEWSATDACLCMHTALRKVCDSTPTSIAYNLIQIIDVRPAEINAWIILGELVADALSRKTHPVVSVTSAIKKLDRIASDKICTYRDRGNALPDNTWPVLHALTCTFRLFTDIDIACMSSYLAE